MSIIISNMNMPLGCQRCKFFRERLFGNGLDYLYSCILGAKDFPMPWIRQMDERASDCPIKSLDQEPILDKIISEATSLKISYTDYDKDIYRRGVNDVVKIIDSYTKDGE